MDWQSILTPQPKDLETALQSRSRLLPFLIPSQAQWLLFHNSLHFAGYRAPTHKCPSDGRIPFFATYRKTTPSRKLFPQNQSF